MDRRDFTEPQAGTVQLQLCFFWAVWDLQIVSSCKLQLILYSPYGPYGLYRASVPLEYSYNTSHTRVHTHCTEPQWLYSTSKLLLPLCALQTAQNHIACTIQLHLNSPFGPYTLNRASVPLQYISTTCPIMGRTKFRDISSL